MQLKTKHFGLVEIDEKGIIDFPEGLPGFEDVKKFVLLGSPDQNSPFQWLQGVDKPDLALVVIDPRTFMPNYDIDVDDTQVAVLDIKEDDKLMVYSIVVVPEDISKMTANLKYPVIINIDNKKGKQIALDKEDYQIRHYILEELRKTGGHK